MSVAFRRESDDEHLEPKFELPIPPGPNRVTARGLALIRARIAALEAAIAGVGADEAALTAHRRDLRYWQTREITAELMPVPDGATVAFGTEVVFTLGGRERRLAIVGDDEADPAAGRIAWTAPLARALMGAEADEVLPFGGQDEAITVLAIAPLAAGPEA